MNPTSLHLFKQNFKFSSAHFLIFDSERAEMLHGHNYRVRVDLSIPFDSRTEEKGYLIDFKILKDQIKEQLDLWDEHVLLPGRQKEMTFFQEGASLRVNFRDRIYVFPKNEVVILPVTNTSVELLSGLLCEIFAQKLKGMGVSRLRVSVEETSGQAASTVKVLQ